MATSEGEFEIAAPSEGEPTLHCRNARFRRKRNSDACSSVSLADIQDAKFFVGRSPAFISIVADYLQLETFVPGATLMQEGDVGDKLLFLYRGKVDVLVGTKETKVATLGSGAVFGEMALLGAPTRTATIRAAEFCDCRSLDKHTFRRLLRKFPEERLSFEKMARERMKELEQIKANEQPTNPRSSTYPTLPALQKESSLKKRPSRRLQKAVEVIVASRRRSSDPSSMKSFVSDHALARIPSMSAEETGSDTEDEQELHARDWFSNCSGSSCSSRRPSIPGSTDPSSMKSLVSLRHLPRILSMSAEERTSGDAEDEQELHARDMFSNCSVSPCASRRPSIPGSTGETPMSPYSSYPPSKISSRLTTPTAFMSKVVSPRTSRPTSALVSSLTSPDGTVEAKPLNHKLLLYKLIANMPGAEFTVGQNAA